jgi:hypothetical protein
MSDETLSTKLSSDSQNYNISNSTFEATLGEEATGTFDSRNVSNNVVVADNGSTFCRAIDSIETIALRSFSTIESMVKSQSVATNNDDNDDSNAPDVNFPVPSCTNVIITTLL